MAPTRRQILASVPATVALTGCLGDDGDEPSETPSPTPTSVPTTTVSTEEHAELGEILVDEEGRVLYMFDSDEQDAGESTCYDDCADAWPPFIVEEEPTAGDGVTAELTTFEREDGSMQVAADGWPLYYFADDEAAGDASGQGLNGVWWVLRGDGTVVRDAATPTPTPAADVMTSTHPDHGDILVDSDGMVLYMFDVDTQGAGASECYDDCESNWPPLVVEDEPSSGDSVTAELTTFERDDGSMQVAAAGWPLYYFAGDEEPGDANGQGANDVWWVLRPDGTIIDGSEDGGGDDNTPDGGGPGY